MATERERQSIEVLISDYAGVLSNAEADKISGFYTFDAVFMPEKGPTIQSAQKIGEGARKFFKKQTMSLSYSIKDIILEGEYAFVMAHATVDGLDNVLRNVVTRDFFVLKNVSGSWKIFRYIFNAR